MSQSDAAWKSDDSDDEDFELSTGEMIKHNIPKKRKKTSNRSDQKRARNSGMQHTVCCIS